MQTEAIVVYGEFLENMNVDAEVYHNKFPHLIHLVDTEGNYFFGARIQTVEEYGGKEIDTEEMERRIKRIDNVYKELGLESKPSLQLVLCYFY